MRSAKDTLFVMGRPFGPIYGGLMRLRAFAYRRGWLRSERLKVPVISIGNLTMGGTGKTPMVIQVVRLLQNLGRRPAVVSRGYGGRARLAVNVVSDGSHILLDVEQAGDEPRLLAESLPGVPVVTGVRRAMSGRYAVDHLGADVIVLDDGFQHLALHRDLDLVLFKGPTFLGNGRIFPGGDLREPFSALGRASAFVLIDTSPSAASVGEVFRRQLARTYPGRPILFTAYQNGALQPANESAAARAGIERGPCLAFCGLARPEEFRNAVVGAVELKGFRAFADHYPYTADDLAGLVGEAKALGAVALITTAKDLVKLREFHCPLPLYVLPVELALPKEFSRLIAGMFR